MFEKSLYRKARIQMNMGNEQKGLEILSKLMEKKPDIENELQSIRKEVTTPHDRKMRKEIQHEEEEKELYEQHMRRWKSRDDMER